MSSSRRSFYHQAATASAWLILFPFLIEFLSSTCAHASIQTGDPNTARLIGMVFAVISMLGMLTGIVLGIIALFGISKYGTQGILVKSIFGILVPVVLVLLAIPAVMHAREIALKYQQDHQTSNP